MIKVDVTKASLTHAMKKLIYFKGFVFFFTSFLVCNGKLLPLHNLVKSELFYLLESWRYEQNKGAETLTHKKKDPYHISTPYILCVEHTGFCFFGNFFTYKKTK